MTADCAGGFAHFRHLDDYALNARTSAMLRRAHAALDLIGLWLGRRRRRKTLAEIARHGERVMLDLGFDPDALCAEAAKPFWRR